MKNAIQITWFLITIITIPLVLLLLIETNNLALLGWAFLAFFGIGFGGFLVLQFDGRICNE